MTIHNTALHLNIPAILSICCIIRLIADNNVPDITQYCKMLQIAHIIVNVIPRWNGERTQQRYTYMYLNLTEGEKAES
jgi:hypothetical protein